MTTTPRTFAEGDLVAVRLRAFGYVGAVDDPAATEDTPGGRYRIIALATLKGGVPAAMCEPVDDPAIGRRFFARLDDLEPLEAPTLGRAQHESHDLSEWEA